MDSKMPFGEINALTEKLIKDPQCYAEVADREEYFNQLRERAKMELNETMDRIKATAESYRQHS